MRELLSRDISNANLNEWEIQIILECCDLGDQSRRFNMPDATTMLSNLSKSLCLTSRGRGGFQQKMLKSQTQTVNQNLSDNSSKGLFGGVKK